MRADRPDVKIRNVVGDCGADCHSDGAAHVAHHVRQAAREFPPLGRQAAEPRVDAWCHRKRLRKSKEELWQQTLCRTRVGGDAAVVPDDKAEACEPEYRQPAQVDAARRRDSDRYADKRCDAARIDGDSGLRRTEPAHGTGKEIEADKNRHQDGDCRPGKRIDDRAGLSGTDPGLHCFG